MRRGSRAITTSIKDAPTIADLQGPDPDHVQPIPDDWTFPPGVFRAVIRSYCLHAGAYGPTTGDGYLIAPLKGDRAQMIRDILPRSVRYPGIAQHDVLRLIWGIEGGAQRSSFYAGFKGRVAPLLANEETVVLNLEPKRAEVTNATQRGLGGLIPGGLRKVVDRLAELRNRMTGITSFEELERIAVKAGAAPWGKDSRKDVKPGSWAYVGHGFYIRAFPASYPTTTLEVFGAVAARWTRDAEGRPTRTWRSRSIVFRHPDGRTATLENEGYVVASNPPAERAVPGGGSSRYNDGSLGDMGHYRDGLRTASKPTDLAGKLKWTVNPMNRVDSAFATASNSLAGDERGGPAPKPFDPTPNVATPANTSKQRLALTGSQSLQ